MHAVRKWLAVLTEFFEPPLEMLPLPRRVARLLRDAGRVHNPTLYELRYFAERLAALGTEAVDPLILAMFNNRNRFVQQVAADALGRIGEARAVPPLIELLKIETFEVAVSAAKALGQIGDPAARDALQFAADYGTSRLRQAAREALMQMMYQPIDEADSLDSTDAA